MKRIVWTASATIGCLLALLGVLHLFWPASRINEAISTLPVMAHGQAFPLPTGMVLMLMGAAVMLLSGLPEILGIHTAPPLHQLLSAWKADLALTHELIDDAAADVLVAGDLNATLRHGRIGAITPHMDVLSSIRASGRGIWPLAAPQVVRSSIDQILVPMTGYAIQETEIIDINGSDHAAIATTILMNS